MVRSAEHAATHVPSGWKRACRTGPSWSKKVRRQSWVCTSHNRTALSSPQEVASRESGLTGVHGTEGTVRFVSHECHAADGNGTVSTARFVAPRTFFGTRNGIVSTVRFVSHERFCGKRKRNGKYGTVHVPRTPRERHAVLRMWCGLTRRYNHAVISYHTVRYGIMQHAIVTRITTVRQQMVNPPGWRSVLTYNQKTTSSDTE